VKTLYLAIVLLLFVAPCAHGAEPDDKQPLRLTAETSHLLTYILEEAVRRGYARLSLETGSAEAFEPARQLYANFGFAYCGPFADYVEDPYSVFMTREL
jgi:putative acetyltransferase